MNDGGADGLVVADWGSSARRIYRLDAAGRVIDEHEDDLGVLKIAPGAFPAAIEGLRARFGNTQLLMAGMVGSNRGWVEAPYISCPATIDDVVAGLRWIEPGRAAIVPGVSFLDQGHADVMRGEEVQSFGAQALGLASGQHIICSPGTHTKWIESDGDAVLGFRTVMTGELFSLLRQHSILSDLLDGPAGIDDAFAAGVEKGYGGAVLGAELFQVRGRALLGVAREQAGSFVSGLLIGSDVRAGLAGAAPRTEILVIGRDSLVQLYAAALMQCGFVAREADGALAFVAGMRAIWERVR